VGWEKSSCYPWTWISGLFQCIGLVLSGTLSHCHGPLSSTWQVDCSMVSLFSWNCLAGLLEDVPLAVRQRLPARYGKVSDSGWTWLIQEGGLDVEDGLHGILGHWI
jgi:hypothetical protein